MDSFGNKKPVPIEVGEWWFNGRIIQEQDHPTLSKYVSFNDGDNSYMTETHSTFREAVRYCKDHPCLQPKNYPKDYGV
jgi:hypothetical protein